MTFFIAEAGVNHNGSLDLACQLVDEAWSAGADAVKFQTFRAQDLVTTGPQVAMLKGLELDRAAHERIARHCADRGIEFMSTPFDIDSVDLLRELGVKRLKIASGEITNAPLLLRAARSGLPLIVSTGMATLGEIENALGVLAFGMMPSLRLSPCRESFCLALTDPDAWRVLRDRVTLLHCTTAYPATADTVNLLAMDTIRDAFGIPVGYSDHTKGWAVAVAAVARGARVIEKHLTLDRDLVGPDHRASIEPDGLAALIEAVRVVDRALGSARKQPARGELETSRRVRKGLVARRAIAFGEVFSADHFAAKRPENGRRSPFDCFDLLGMTSWRDFDPNEPI